MRFSWHFLLSSSPPEDNFLSTLGWKHLSHSRRSRSRSRCRFPRPQDEDLPRSFSLFFLLPPVASHGVINYTAFSFSSAPWHSRLTCPVPVTLSPSLSSSFSLCIYISISVYFHASKRSIFGLVIFYLAVVLVLNVFQEKQPMAKIDKDRDAKSEQEREREEAAADRDGDLLVESLSERMWRTFSKLPLCHVPLWLCVCV